MADRALYAAKRGGRDAWAWLTATRCTPAAVEALVESELAAAIAGGTIGFATSRPLAVPGEWSSAGEAAAAVAASEAARPVPVSGDLAVRRAPRPAVRLAPAS